jgi:cell division septum initiation protein DivIVA
MGNTEHEYHAAAKVCKSIFEAKLLDYGSNWRILRPSSMTDQLLIKARRIRNLEGGLQAQVAEGIEPEYIGIVNYGIMALIQCRMGFLDAPEESTQAILEQYNTIAQEIFELMQAKNNDYGEAWRDMRLSSLTDMVLNRIHRIKQLEDNQGKTSVSEGIESNYMDMVNYALFALIKLGVGK